MISSGGYFYFQIHPHMPLHNRIVLLFPQWQLADRTTPLGRHQINCEIIYISFAFDVMVSATANTRKPPLSTFVLQLEEARAEWRRRCKRTGLSSASDSA
jgi:hypothetical protein